MVDVIDGYTLYVEWREPEGRTGIFVGYVIRAYSLDMNVTAVEAQFNSTTLSGNMSTASII